MSALTGQVILTLTLMSCLLAAVITDLRTRRIPNVLCGGALGVGLILQCMLFGIEGLASGVAGALVGLAILLPLYLVGGMGAGDVKLMTSIGGFLGPSATLIAGVTTLVVGGGIALVTLAWQHALIRAASRRGLTNSLVQAGRLCVIEIPYGLAIAFGVAAAIALRA